MEAKMKRTLILLLGLLVIVLFSSCAKEKEEGEKKVVTISETENLGDKVTIHLKDGTSTHAAEIRAAVYNDRTASIFIDYVDPINVDDIQSIEIKP
jgi:hypothetical protein